jgi:archaellum biogenesis protein FlaJ (TadC family)
MLYPIVGSVITAFVSAIKELILDSKTDWKDLYAALIGSATVFVATIIGFLFFLGSN